MRKVAKSTKKGFTLVELIVVLVILAVLAAMLIPALTGYITKAKQEKDYQAASTVYTAAQSLATEDYAKGKTLGTNLTLANLIILSGTDKIKDAAYKAGTATTEDPGKAYQIEVFSVTFDNTTWYNYSASTNEWTPGTAAASGTTSLKTSTTGGGAGTT